MKLSEKYIFYGIFVVLIILLVVILILSLINSVNEHEFITDLTSIKFEEGNQLMKKMCGIDNCFKSQFKSDACKSLRGSSSENIYNVNPDVMDLIGAVSNYKDAPEGSCSEKLFNSLNKYFSISKLEAKQILLNNQLLIDYIYGNKKSKKYFKDVLNIIKVLTKSYSGKYHKAFLSDIKVSLDKLNDDYKDLSDNDQKNIDIVLSKIFATELLNVINPISYLNLIKFGYNCNSGGKCELGINGKYPSETACKKACKNP